MRKAALLYNPDSGGRRRKRQAELESVLALLRGAGLEVELMLPHSAAEAQEQVRHAIRAGCDTVFGCGGDGTIHNIVQVLANTPVALAILPMGTANALAHDLGLPMSVVKAARAVLNPATRRVALGRIHYHDFSGHGCDRFFVVAAGAGVDAHLFYKLHTGTKKRMGMTAYYAKAWHLWFSHAMIRFQIEFCETGSNETRRAEVTELLAVRIRNFGGVLQELAPGASLERNDLQIVFCRTASRLAYLHYVARGLLRRKWKVSGIDLAYTGRVSCSYSSDATSAGTRQLQRKVYVETDGELVGTLPAEITVAPDALTLLGPSNCR
jgi:diacylglycerol kinase (ATP)